jgi:alpha-ribazole phosphatase
LHEINFGKVEGLTFKEISQLYPDLAESWPTRDLTFRFPGGESIHDLNNRVSKFLDRLEKHAPEDTILIVAHSGVLRLLICHLLRIEPWHWRQLRTDLASLSILDTYPQGAILNLLNDISHLK